MSNKPSSSVAMIKLSSSWPNGRMFGDNDSGPTGRAIFSAEFSGGKRDPLIAADGSSLRVSASVSNSSDFAVSIAAGIGGVKITASSSKASSTDDISEKKSIRDCGDAVGSAAGNGPEMEAGPGIVAALVDGAAIGVVVTSCLLNDTLSLPVTAPATALAVELVGASSRTKPAAANAILTDSRTASATAADRRNRTSVFAGCTFTSTSSSGVSINNNAAG